MLFGGPISGMAVGKTRFHLSSTPAQLQEFLPSSLHFSRQILSEDYLNYLLLPGDSLQSCATCQRKLSPTLPSICALLSVSVFCSLAAALKFQVGWSFVLGICLQVVLKSYVCVKGKLQKSFQQSAPRL